MVLTEVDKVMVTAIGGLSWWRGVSVAMKNGGTGFSCVSGFGHLLQWPWNEGVAAQMDCIFVGAP